MEKCHKHTSIVWEVLPDQTPDYVLHVRPVGGLKIIHVRRRAKILGN